MKVTLPTGDIVQITPAMATSVRRATPVPNNPYFWELLEYDSTRSMGALVQQGLAVYSARRDGWVLTPLGIELLVELRRLSHEKEEKKNSGRMRGKAPPKRSVPDGPPFIPRSAWTRQGACTTHWSNEGFEGPPVAKAPRHRRSSSAGERRGRSFLS